MRHFIKIPVSVSFGILLLCSSNFYAGIRPSFYLDYVSWEATNIIVVTEGDEIDGNVTVFESLKGDLASGEAISVPELAVFKPESSRLIKEGYFDDTTSDHPKYVSGSRMILFLKRGPAPTTTTPAKWEAASREGMSVSVVWIEGEQSYAFIQVINPGDSLLVEYGKSETEIKKRIAEVTEIGKSLNTIIAMPEKASRARAFVPFTSSDLYFVEQRAFEELRNCGVAALPVLREMLNDTSKLKVHDDVIASMTAVGGKSIGPELIEIVKEETRFWKGRAPTLTTEWWNQINEPETEILRGNYMKLYQALRSLKTLKLPESKDAVIELRDFWRSLPQLEDKSGLDAMSETCDEILIALGIPSVTKAKPKSKSPRMVTLPVRSRSSLRSKPFVRRTKSVLRKREIKKKRKMSRVHRKRSRRSRSHSRFRPMRTKLR